MDLQTEVDIDLKKTLKEVFGYSQFRGLQETIIRSILAGKNTFVIMPTGAGKSLCYQLPAIVSEGTAIVVSPLIALMKNQVDQLNSLGVEAHFLNSTLNKKEANKVKSRVLAGTTKLLYMAPESLNKEANIEFLKEAKLSFVAIDEAHCISEWGHDFRPEYRRIRSIIDNISDLPIIALTATATPKVQQDIQKNLSMDEANIFKTSFNRQNLYYEVQAKKGAKKKLIKYVKSRKGKSGIIYCLSRKKVEEICELLVVNDIKALPYHAGLDSAIRMQNQDAFLNEDVDVIVATIAFGMGIDKPDVRFVIHYDTPKSLEGYYQETGRAGRDGLEADCVMFYSPSDIIKLEKFNKDKPASERDNAKHLLQEMMDYATSGMCRRKQLLYYFGELIEGEGSFNDNCDKPTKKFHLLEEIIWAIATIKDTEEKFSVNHIIDILLGTESDYIQTYKHDKLNFFGKGKSEDDKYWRAVIRQLMIMGYLERDIDNYDVMKVTEKGYDYLRNPKTLAISERHDFSKISEEDEDDLEIQGGQVYKSHDEVLFRMLKSLCRKVAKEKNYPPYAIFQDPSLEEMATTYPTTKDELAQVNGVGMGKVRKYGTAFINLIKKYVEDNDIETASDIVVKSAGTRSKIKVYIIQQIDRKIDLEDIAEAQNKTLSQILDEIEHICYAGTKLNLDYYIDQVLEPERQEDIYDYFMAADTDNIQVAMQELDNEYAEEELRLMRIQFLSEVAN